MLPTPEQRQALRDKADSERRERDQRARTAAEEKQRQDAEARRCRINSLAERAVRSIEYAAADDKTECVVHLSEGREWDEVETDIARGLMEKLATPGYSIEPVIDCHTYREFDRDEGYPIGDGWWVDNYYRSLKITWNN